jgi:hypothetical protein
LTWIIIAAHMVMDNEKDLLFSRRIFCSRLLVGGAALILAACTRPGPEVNIPKRNYVFKYPENADEIADFFEIFSDRDFSADSAIQQLKITGKPENSNLPLGTRAIYPAQNDLIKSVQIDTQQGFLAGIRLFYTHPIEVSFGQLESRVTPHYAPHPPGVVGSISIYAANVEPPMRTEGTPSNGRQVYSFSASGRTYMGRISVSAEADASGGQQTGTHSVWEVGFIK